MDTTHATKVGTRDIFATTHWSVVMAADSSDVQKSLAALQRLCETYWRPVYVFVRSKQFSPDDAEELTQEYFARLLKSDSLQQLHPAKGKFRAFLLASLQNFLANEWDRRKTLKRGGDRVIISLDQASGETWLRSVDGESPEKLFERRWAMTLLERVLEQVQEEFASENQLELFKALKPALTGDGMNESYRELGRRFGMEEGAVKVAVHRLRKKYRSCLRAEIAQTVSSSAEIEEEIQYLFRVFK